MAFTLVLLLAAIPVIGVVSATSQDDRNEFVTIYMNSSSPASIDNSSCWLLGNDHPCTTLDLAMHGLWNLSQETDSVTTLIIASGQYLLSANTPTDFNRTGPLVIMILAHRKRTLCRQHLQLDVNERNCRHFREKNHHNNTVEIECEEGAGFSFTCVRGNITLRMINFNSCGALRTSTSYNFNKKDPNFLQFHVGLYFSTAPM